MSRLRLNSVARAAVVLCVAASLTGAMPVTASAGGSSASDIDRDATLSISTSSLPNSLDPFRMPPGLLLAASFMYDTLFILGPKGELQPGLAETWKVSSDGTTIDVTLRDDAVFNDGSPVDSAAIKASIDRARTDSVHVAQLRNIASIETPSPSTVRILLTQADVSVLFTLGGVPGSIVNPSAIGTDLSKTSAGSTPYVVAEFLPPSRLVLERAPNVKYWDNKAWTPRQIEVTANTDATAINNGLQTGQFDAARLQTDVDEAARTFGSKVEVVGIQSNAQFAMFFRSDNPATPEAAVRTAIGQAIDRKAIATNVMSNCEPAEQMLRKGSPGYVKKYAPFKYNPKAAERTFQQAGFTSFEMTISATQVEEKKFIEVAQQELKDVGVDMTISTFTTPEAVQQFNSGSRVALTLGYAPLPDLAMTVTQEFLGSKKLASGTDGENLTTTINAANALPLESSEREKQLEEVMEDAMQLGTLIPICSITNPWGYQSDVKGIDQNMPNAFSTFNARYWHKTK